MYNVFPESVQDVASVVALVLPGFLAVSLFEVTNPSLARDRLPLQWTMWSLSASLVFYPVTHGVYSIFNWGTDPLDYRFNIPLLLSAVAVGYVTGRVAGSDLGRRLTAALRLFLRSWVWVEVISEKFEVNVGGKREKLARSVVVHLKNGTILHGYPRYYTDDRRETTREIFLTWPTRYDHASGVFRPVPDADGVLVDSNEISYLALRTPVDIPLQEDSEVE